MKIEPARWIDVHEVAMLMRERDFAEFSAVSPFNDRKSIAHNLANRYGERDDVMAGFLGNSPVCIGGAIQSRPNVAHLLFFATDLFPKVALPLTRWIVKQLFPRLERAGIHRFDLASLAEHTEAHAWLRTLGFQQEGGPMLNYGKNRESFVQFARCVDVRPVGA